jgi:hypothetical protein
MKDKVKDPSKKQIVEAYQQQIRIAINNILNVEEKLKPSTKAYVNILEENIKLAPFILGYLERPEPKKKKSNS